MRRSICLLFCVGVAGCDEALAPKDPAFVTDATEYVLTRDATGARVAIPVTFSNKNGSATYFVNCQGATSLTLERRVGGKWREAWSPINPECLSAPIVVAPGQSKAMTVFVYDCPPAFNCQPKFDTSVEDGTYRLVWHAVLSNYSVTRYPFGDVLPLAQRVSNVFQIRVPPA